MNVNDRQKPEWRRIVPAVVEDPDLHAVEVLGTVENTYREAGQTSLSFTIAANCESGDVLSSHPHASDGQTGYLSGTNAQTPNSKPGYFPCTYPNASDCYTLYVLASEAIFAMSSFSSSLNSQ